MMNLVDPKIETYLEQLLPARPALFGELEQWAAKRHFPAVGPLVGRMLEWLARLVAAKRILELGSGFGYSGLWFCRALPQDGEIVLTDFDKRNLKMARKNFRRAGYDHLATFKQGDALKLLQEMEGPFDIIFNDIDKEFYPRVIEPVYDRLRPGGLFITDNSLGYGSVTVLDEVEAAPAIREFNRRLKEHTGFMTVQVPLREGLSVGLKL
jgi:predicted O-methyltransferase YrrM